MEQINASIETRNIQLNTLLALSHLDAGVMKAENCYFDLQINKIH